MALQSMWPSLEGLRRPDIPPTQPRDSPHPIFSTMPTLRKLRLRALEWWAGQPVLVAEPGLEPGPGSSFSLPGKMVWQKPARGPRTGPLSHDSSCPGLSSTHQEGEAPATRASVQGPQPTQLSVAWPTRRARRKGERDPGPEAAGSPAQCGKGQGEEDPREHPPASSRALRPALGLTNPRGPGSPLQTLLKTQHAHR